MLPDATLPVPASLADLLAPVLIAPTFRTFTIMACGLLAHTGKGTVCGDADRGGPCPVLEP